MIDITKKAAGAKHGAYVFKKKRRRKPSNIKNNLFWCGIILILTLLFGAVIGFYSHFFEDYLKSEGERITVSERNIPDVLKDFLKDRFNR